MSFPYRLAAVALAAHVSIVFAQANSSVADPADAAAPIMAPAYVSVFKTYRPAAEVDAPDRQWLAANRAVRAGTDAMPAPADGAEPAAMHMQHGDHHDMEHMR